jgi:hypothetical protein
MLVADGVCEVRITTTGDFTFTPPSGIAKLAAVLVAGGGGGYVSGGSSYAGNGGAVVYFDRVPLGGPVAGTVGTGGTGHGGDTLVGTTTASGGSVGSSSGPECYDSVSHTYFYFGGGAKTSAQGGTVCLPGTGFSLSELSSADTALFPAAADGTAVYGGGGAANAADPGVVSLLAGNGGSVNATLAAPGSGGLVIFRFAPAVPVAPPATSPALAATGSDVPWAVPGISAAFVAAGALLLALRRRRPAQR